MKSTPRSFRPTTVFMAASAVAGISCCTIAVLEKGPDLWESSSGKLLIAGLLFLAMAAALLLQNFYQAQAWEKRRNQTLQEEWQKAVSEASSEMEASRKRFQTLAKIAPVGIFETDLDGCIRFASRRWLEMVGWRKSQAFGKPWFDAVVEAERSRVQEAWAQAVAKNCPMEMEFRVQRPDGSESWLLSVTTRKESVEGVEDGLVGTFSDVSRHKKEQHRQQVFQQRLQHAERLESLGMMAGGVAHDLNNLLVGILGNAEILDQMLPQRQEDRDAMDGLLKSSHRASALARKLLQYTGNQLSVKNSINLSEFAGNWMRLLQETSAEPMELQLNCPPDLPAMQGDVIQLRQLLSELTLNAREASGEKPLWIRVATGCRSWPHSWPDDSEPITPPTVGQPPPPGEYLWLEFEDHSCGMPADVGEKIFDPFFSTKFMGRGLGLATVLGIVRGHDGAIQFISQSGKGTQFRLWFPVEPQDKDSFREGAGFTASSRGQILLLDSSLERGEELVNLLSNFKHQAVLCTQASEALSLLSSQPFHAIGFQADGPWQKVLEHGWKDLPPLPLVAWASQEQQALFPKPPPDRPFHYLQIPFANDALIQAFDKLLPAVI
ncbi:MAG: PAS domain S-box protein [Planctomycetota bacterium]|nr:MAG: PAS domain S-box protein [Planctomycetota bacterium]